MMGVTLEVSRYREKPVAAKKPHLQRVGGHSAGGEDENDGRHFGGVAVQVGEPRGWALRELRAQALRHEPHLQWTNQPIGLDCSKDVCRRI
jgi:hypothetical protein